MQKSEFKFSNPKLVSLIFKMNNCSKKQTDSDVNIGISVKTNIDKESINEATVELNIEIGELSDSFPFFINLIIGARFKLDSAIEGTDFDKLLKVNAPALLISYARPIIASITNNAGMEPVNLPYINFTDQSK